jgi:diguanylate cyclase (GGDEF)-like protein
MTRLDTLLSPVGLLRLLVAVTGVALVLMGVVVVILFGGLTGRSEEVTRNTRAALFAAESEAEVAKLQGVLRERLNLYLSSPEVAALPAAQQIAIALEAARKDSGEPAPGTERPSILLSIAEVRVVQDTLEFLNQEEDSSADGGVSNALQETETALSRYYDEPSPGNLRLLMVSLDSLLEETDQRASLLNEESRVQEDQLTSATSTAKLGVLVAILVVSILLLTLSQRVTKLVRLAIETGRREQMGLEVATERLQFRNDQLNALYEVFNEITDILSLDYVVKATLFQSLKIMRADMVVLRILRGESLEVAGAMTGSKQEIVGIAPVKLGEGPTGRTAKRGRTLRIDEGGERTMAPPASDDDDADQLQGPLAGTPLESGLIVPLIVGARVVGTLSCWSRGVGTYGESDERILEMMASQVATAIVAADTTDKSERRATHDPLTLLPNRRQLDEDISGRLADLARDGRYAVVAMIDIDQFKRFNDDYGHRVGDVTLQKVASVLRSSARDQDMVYRYGGEEFVVVFTDPRPEEATSLAERMRLAVETAPLSGEHLDPVGPLTISIGLALLPQHGTDLNLLIDRADKAMYQAKAEGRNCVKVWSEELLPETTTEAA